LHETLKHKNQNEQANIAVMERRQHELVNEIQYIASQLGQPRDALKASDKENHEKLNKMKA
jgi:hypothetical protein